MSLASRRRWIALVGVWVAVAAPLSEARAAEFRAGARASAEFQTEPFGEDLVDDAFSLRVGPTFGLSNNEGRLLYEIESRTEYEAFLNEDRDLNAWEQFASAEVTYAISPRTVLTLEDQMRYAASVRFTDEGNIGVIDAGRERYIRNAANWRLTHALTPRFSLDLSGNYSLIDFVNDLDVRSDDRSLGSTASGSYRISGSDMVGLGYGFVYQGFDRTPDRPSVGGRRESRALINRAFAFWQHSFDDTLSLFVQLGPAWIKSELGRSYNLFPCQDANMRITQQPETDCTDAGEMIVGPEVPINQRRSTSTTVFGYAALEKSWRRIDTALTFRRQENAASGQGVATTYTTAAFEVSTVVDAVWRVRARAEWNERKSTTDQVALLGLGRVSVEQWAGIVSVRRRLSAFSSATLQLRYFNQRTDNTRQGFRETNNFAAVIRIDYGLKPFHFDFL